MKSNSFLFWQPRFDYLTFFQSGFLRPKILIFLNYFIWFFLFYVSYLLIASDINFFWQILIATILGEIVEKTIKSKIYWRRPMYQRHHHTPVGLVARWYNSGSFPSGHTVKTAFFFLLIVTNPVFSPLIFLSITIPLLFFRILVGFHYPADVFGGVVIGLVLWLITSQIIAPSFVNDFVKIIFDYVFFRS